MQEQELAGPAGGNAAPELPAGKRTNIKKEIIGWVEAVVGAIIVVALIITFVGRPIVVDGKSMQTTLMNGDRIIITPLYSQLKHNDIVVIRRKNATPLVKRVIAVGGETIDIDWETKEVSVDGRVLDEPFIDEATAYPLYRPLDFPLTVPEGSAFVMGDNRNNSSDSRDPAVGPLDVRDVMGKMVFRIWPLDKIGMVTDYTYE